ncbi:MAG: type I restriction endonuclease subunit S [Rhizobiaceae bacterium]|nr:type I restriction endonuclease subunit S [Rhizobiaceae bacterium]
MNKLVLLRDLLEFTRDGEWGKGEARDGLVEMAVIRGTDFGAVRFNDFSSVPTRFIPEKAAARKKLQPGDILLETAGGTKDQPTGRTVFLSPRHFTHKSVPLICASFSRFLRVKKDLVEPRYLFWYLQSIYESREMLPYHIQHTGVARFQYTDFASQWQIPIPDIDHQTAIANVLGSLDDKIELNRRMNETLEAMAQAIFRDWFVDFGPTRRKLEGAADPITVMGGLVQDAERAQALADLFPAALGDDGLPEGWNAGRLDELAEVHMGASPKGDTYNEDGVGTPLANGPVEFGDYFLVERKWTTSPTRLSQVGDFVICVRGSTTGRHVFADGVYCLGRGVAALRGLPGEQDFVNTTIIMHLDTLLQKTTGSVFPNLSGDDIRSFSCLVPPKSVRRQFSLLAEPLRMRIWHNVHENHTLAATRDLLLPKLMSGEIRLSEAEDLVEAAQ